MSVSFPEQQRRARMHLCIWCAAPAQYITRLSRHGVHCRKHARIICENYRKWKARTGARKKG